MADTDINIVVTATDKASAALKGIRGSIITMNQGLQLAQQAFNAVKNVVDASIGAYVKYADQVRRLSQLNGTSAQETSRLIQVMDDHKVTVEALTMATRKLAQQGESLTIDSLAKMSDEYKSLGTNADKAKFLLDKFGRSGFQLAETMNLGSAAINAESDAISNNLIMTQKQLDMARSYERMLDELNDTVFGYTVLLGTQLLPLQIGLTRKVIEGTEAWGGFDDQLQRIADLLTTKGNPALTGLAVILSNVVGLLKMPGTAIDMWLDIPNIMDEIATAAEDTGDKIGALSDAEQSFLSSIQDVTPKAIREFVLLQERIQKVKDLIAAGWSFDVIVNVLQFSSEFNPGKTTGKTISKKGANIGTVVGKPKREASGGSFSGMAWVGDSPGGLTPYSELVYAPHGAQVFKASESRAMASGAPRAAMGGSIPAMTGETNLSYSTIRQLASAIAGEMSRING